LKNGCWDKSQQLTYTSFDLKKHLSLIYFKVRNKLDGAEFLMRSLDVTPPPTLHISEDSLRFERGNILASIARQINAYLIKGSSLLGFDGVPSGK
jgi:hypothetical protein